MAAEKHYDSIRDTWIYQEIQEQVQREEQQRQRHELIQLALRIVEQRFPRLHKTAQHYITDVQTVHEICTHIGHIALARNEKDLRQYLLQLPAEKGVQKAILP